MDGMGEALATLLEQTTKNLANTLEDFNKVYPPPFKGKFLALAALRKILLPRSSPDSEAKFFRKLQDELAVVNDTFERSARQTLDLYKSLRSAWSRWLLQKVKRSAKTRSIEGVAAQARICLEYAQINTVALRRIVEEHDKVLGNDLGRIVYDSVWRNQTGLAIILHSPLIMELAAVAQSATAKHCCVGSIDAQSASSSPRITAPSESVFTEDGEMELQCAICLDTLFRPVALGCGHIFCMPCLGKAVGKGCDIMEGIDPLVARTGWLARCPECRQCGVFRSAEELSELGSLIRSKNENYWVERAETEKEEKHVRQEQLLRRLEESAKGR